SSASAASTGSTAPGRRLRAPARRSSVASSIGPPGGASAVSRSAARADEPRDCRTPWARPPLPRAGAPAADADARRGPRHPERRDVAETRERRAPLHRIVLHGGEAAREVAFTWQARFPLAPLLFLRVVDRYAGGAGSLEARLLGVRMMRQAGPETTLGE